MNIPRDPCRNSKLSYDLVSKVPEHSSGQILLIKQVTKTNPDSKGKGLDSTSWCLQGGNGLEAAIFQAYIPELFSVKSTRKHCYIGPKAGLFVPQSIIQNVTEKPTPIGSPAWLWCPAGSKEHSCDSVRRGRLQHIRRGMAARQLEGS